MCDRAETELLYRGPVLGLSADAPTGECGRPMTTISDKQRRLLRLLAERDEWVSAADLADALLVSTRSVRNYIAALKQAHGDDLIASSERGYRISLTAYTSLPLRKDTVPERPERVRQLTHALLARAKSRGVEGADVHELAEGLHVSEATVELDLVAVRALLAEHELEVTRSGGRLILSGDEIGRRRLIARLHRESHTSGFLDLQKIADAFDAPALPVLRRELSEALDANGFQVNELALPDVLLEFVVSASRVRAGHALDAPVRAQLEPHEQLLRQILETLFERHLEPRLPEPEMIQAAAVLSTRAATPAFADALQRGGRTASDIAQTVRDIVATAASNYSVLLDGDEFLARLTTHVANVLARSRDRTVQYNPITSTIKSGYPMVYDISVYIASGLQQAYDVSLDDDEIAYIALHVGSHLERHAGGERPVSCTLVCPNYYGMHQLLRDRLEDALGDEIEVVAVVSSSDVPWERFATELVVTTVPPSVYRDSVLLIQPFFAESDVERVRRMVRTIRDRRSREHTRARLLQYLRPEMFFRNLAGVTNETETIARLGTTMVEAGVVDESYIEGAIERERLSSTVFAESVAVPHAMTMEASQTAIAIALNDAPIPWHGSQVQLVCQIAFAKEDRRLFQSVFNQFVSVFSEIGRVQHLLRTVTDFESFVEQLAIFMEEP